MLDILIIGFFIFQILSGWTQGFIKVVLKAAVAVLSLFVAYLLIRLIGGFSVQGLLKMLLFWLLFLVLRALLLFLIRKFSGLFNKIPVIGTANRLLGSITAGIFALLFSYLIIRVLVFVALFTSDVQILLNQSRLYQLLNIDLRPVISAISGL